MSNPLRFALFGAAIASALALASPAEACELCPTDYEVDIEEAAQLADLIAIVSLADASVQPDPKPTSEGPDTIALTLHDVLKGDPKTVDEKTIIANSWDGMCDYGVIIEPGSDARYLVLLERRTDQYVQVKQGCAPYQLPVVDGKVAIPSGRGSNGATEADGDPKPTALADLPAALKLDAKPDE